MKFKILFCIRCCENFVLSFSFSIYMNLMCPFILNSPFMVSALTTHIFELFAFEFKVRRGWKSSYLNYSLIHSFCCYRKLVRCPGNTEIRIFKLLSKYIADPLLAKKFVDILLPFLSKRVQGSGKNILKLY